MAGHADHLQFQYQYQCGGERGLLRSLTCTPTDHRITHDQRHTLEKHPINVTRQPFGKPGFMTKGTIRNTDTFERRLNIRNVYIGTLCVILE